MTETTLAAPEPVAFSARIMGPAAAEITLDGQRIENHLAGFTYDVEAGDSAGGVPQVVLRLAARATFPAVLDGLARVYVAEEQPVIGAAEFLAAIDPEELERAALARIDLGTGPGATTQAILTQLGEWARGA